MWLTYNNARIQTQNIMKKNNNICVNIRKLQSKKLCLEISNQQKSFDITQLKIISHGEISQTLFTFELVQNKTNQLS
jgi:hypothetical protein